MKHRHQSVIPLALGYLFILLCIGLAGPVRIAKAYLQEIIKGSGNVIQQSRPVTGFNAVVLSGVGELSAVQGANESLTLEAEDNILPVIETQVKDDCLYIRIKSDTNIHPTKPIRYSLTAKALERVGLSGAVKAHFSKLNGDMLKLSASGATRTTIDEIKGSELTAELSGASSVSIAGSVNRQKIVLTGACRFAGTDLACKTADVMATGASRAELQVSDSLTAKASGASSIRYKGNPNVTRDTSGVSSVRTEQ